MGVVGVHHHTYPKIQVGVSESPKHGPPCDLLLASKLYSSRVELILLIFKSSLRAILFHHRTRTRTVWRSGSALPRPQATFKGWPLWRERYEKEGREGGGLIYPNCWYVNACAYRLMQFSSRVYVRCRTISVCQQLQSGPTVKQFQLPENAIVSKISIIYVDSNDKTDSHKDCRQTCVQNHTLLFRKHFTTKRLKVRCVHH